jgi:hypothetical protein
LQLAANGQVPAPAAALGYGTGLLAVAVVAWVALRGTPRGLAASRAGT